MKKKKKKVKLKSKAMDISFWSILVSVLVTILYFSFVKPVGEVSSQSLLFQYVGVLVFLQLILSVVYVSNKCGGGSSLGKNIGLAVLYTLVPWVLLFGVMLVVLAKFPVLKEAFSDVLGYFVVSGSAGALFSDILIDTNVEEAIRGSPAENRASLEKAAAAIMKMAGNKSILLNTMTVSNFESVWSTLEALMRPELLNNAEQLKLKKAELLSLVSRRENIGESMWYIYTAVLVSSVTYYYLSSRGCVQDAETIKATQKQYASELESQEAARELSEKTKYAN